MPATAVLPSTRRTPDPAAIDVDRLDEVLSDCLTRRQVAKLARVSDATVHAWQGKGCQGLDGRMHVLPAARIGCRWYTHKADVAAFLSALNARPA